VFGRSNEYNGTLLTPVQGAPEDGALEIDLLKLHGSLNFPARVMRGSRGSHSIATSLDDPFIMPPVFNKQSGGHQQSIWKRALEHLRGAKNVVIVGYSLPKTDIYMQYFLKAALGPNVNLNKIFVFDPALHRDGTAGREMEARYAECFSPQLKGRIDFRPGLSSQHPQQLGTAEQFVRTLENSPNSLIF
jgi:hypothetical protein